MRFEVVHQYILGRHFFSEKASNLNRSCGNWVIMFGVHLDKPHIIFWIPIIFLASFFMVGTEYGTA